MLNCNKHTYVETDPHGTIECTECGVTNQSLPASEESVRIEELVAAELKTAIEEFLGDTCRNGKPWDSCTCC